MCEVLMEADLEDVDRVELFVVVVIDLVGLGAMREHSSAAPDPALFVDPVSASR
jgi:hypothetical protein